MTACRAIGISSMHMEVGRLNLVMTPLAQAATRKGIALLCVAARVIERTNHCTSGGLAVGT